MRIVVASDIHYAGPIEQQRRNHETAVLRYRIQKALIQLYRKYVWLDDPQSHSCMLDLFLEQAPTADLVILLGDLSCDTRFIGVADEGARQSTELCIQKITSRFKTDVLVAVGDHDLGKMSLAGGVGGPRITSWKVWTEDLGLPGLWTRTVGRFCFIGLASTILALPVFEPELLPHERDHWRRLRSDYLAQISQLFTSMPEDLRLVLCLHDPTALPYLYQIEAVRRRMPQLVMTLIGHLHSRLVFRLARSLTGMPAIGFLGNTIRRMSTALRQARVWNEFNLHLCPALTGIQLLKDGGFLTLTIDNQTTITPQFHPLAWP